MSNAFEAARKAEAEFLARVPHFNTRETDDEYTSLVERISEAVDRIAELKATDWRTLQLKARAAAWCEDGNAITLSVIQDLVALDVASDQIADLIKEHQKAYQEFEDYCGDFEPGPDWDRLNKAEDAAFRAVCAAPVQTLGDVRKKSEYVDRYLIRVDDLSEEQMELFLQSLIAAPVSLPATRVVKK